ncbi:response regulator transcription factor [Clostridium aciditolerans]|uniref:Stage 0 sporulation protein A homolog n=1 Tax=Clostridium aciditolerans TaxID=339861 RepID=A0A934I0T2_9CLOT|nr:response regulator transcription factor [Clostridium aciditolerans]MBI6875659.1 response regulator transcription factor [Clostridium aciditolerans]
MKRNIKILVVEDDNDINKLLSDMLNMSEYITKSAYSGTEALIYLEQENWDMVLLDLMLPGMDGEELLVKIRELSHMPVVIISAKEETNTKVKTLRIGADDFITKPFDIEEVSARIDSHLRRYKEFSEDIHENILSFGEISLNKDTREVFVNNTNVILTTREFDILQLLMSYPKKVFSKSNVFESVWGNEYICDDNTITVHISNLRNKLSKAGSGDYIQTVWGIGYKLDS